MYGSEPNRHVPPALVTCSYAYMMGDAKESGTCRTSCAYWAQQQAEIAKKAAACRSTFVSLPT